MLVQRPGPSLPRMAEPRRTARPDPFVIECRMAVHRFAGIVLAAVLLASLLIACDTAQTPVLHGSGSEHWQVFGIGLHF